MSEKEFLSYECAQKVFPLERVVFRHADYIYNIAFKALKLAKL